MTADEGWLQVAGLIDQSLVDGPGLRLVVFCQGCPHHCPGCQNPQTHLPIGGEWLRVEEIGQRLQPGDLKRGITFSGGEPFLQAGPLAQLARQVHALDKDVITYTGYVYERLQAMAREKAGVMALLDQTDLLIDGPFVLAQRSLALPFRGSRNQRLIPLSPRGQSLLADIPPAASQRQNLENFI